VRGALALAALLAAAVPQALAQARPAPTAESAAAEAPALLAERDVLFAAHRLAGTEPDFAALATLAVDAAPPPRYRVRDPAADRRYRIALAARQLRAAFAGFDLDGPFLVEFGADILGRDRRAGVIPVDIGDDPRLTLRHPLGGRPYELRFRNADDIRAIPAPDPDAAAALLHGAGLASIGDWAGPGLVRLTVAFAGLLPRIAEAEAAPVLVEILSARVESAGGAALHDFGRIGTTARAAAHRAGPPALRGGDLAGVRVGMTLAEAEAIATRAFPERLGGAFFDGLPDRIRRFRVRPDCAAGVVADIRAFGIPLGVEESYAACLAISEEGPDRAPTGRVSEVTLLRFLPGANDAEVRADLQERFGRPLEAPQPGEFVWVGRDPAGDPTEAPLELRAAHVRVPEGGPGREEGHLLALTLRRFRPAPDSGT
jgi:hypothetical protein